MFKKNKAEKIIEKEYPLKKIDTLQIANPRGDITVTSEWEQPIVRVKATIKAASINTGIAGRDEHLATPDFFDAAQFPLITFTSDSIVKHENAFVAFGTFMMHGISKKIQLPFSINVSLVNIHKLARALRVSPKELL